VTVVATFLDDIAEEQIDWRWQGRLAAGKVTVMEGDPGLGKTTVGIDIDARLSRGGRLPGEHTNCEPMIVGIISDEDGLRDTIIPRLNLADANMENVCQLTGQTQAGHKRSLMFPDDTEEVIRLVRELGIQHLHIDPLAAHAGASVNLYIDQDVRAKIMGPLAAVGEETGVSIILTRHPNKQVGAAALYRGGGSLGIIGAARFGLAFGRDPEDQDRLVIAPVKCNIGPMPPSLAFRLQGQAGSDHAMVKWDREPCYLTADEILLAPPNQSAKLNTATEQWLLVRLVAGPRLVTELEAEAEKADHAWRTVQRAKRALQVSSQRVGFGKESAVYWLLPGQELPPSPTAETDEDPHTPPHDPSPETQESMAVYAETAIERHRTPIEKNGSGKDDIGYGGVWQPMHTPPYMHAKKAGGKVASYGDDVTYTCIRDGCDNPVPPGSGPYAGSRG
jgi:hypothetical protein